MDEQEYLCLLPAFIDRRQSSPPPRDFMPDLKEANERRTLIARIMLRCRPPNPVRHPMVVLGEWTTADLRTLAEGLENGMARRVLKMAPRPLWPNPQKDDDE